MTAVLLAALERSRTLPVVTLQDSVEADRVADDLRAAGQTAMEITLRTPAGLAGIERAAGADLVIGAGTVTSVADVDRVHRAGARFVVTPGWSAEVVQRCGELGLPVVPGVASAGEIMAALAAGLTTVKLFPAQQLGGPAAVRAFAGPFPQVRFVPSGGITAQNAPDYLAVPGVLAVGRTWPSR